MNMVRTAVFKLTNDNWCPSYKLGNEMAVEVSFIPLVSYKTEGNKWRVCIWGEDDTGMEKDFVSESEAITAFLEVIGLNFVNFDNLSERGFYPA
jgi:hypothetical protein